MFSPKNIVVPIDFSVCSDNALETAVEIAELYDAHLHIIHVIINELEQMPFLLLSSEKAADLTRKINENAVREMNCALSLHASEKVHCSTYIETGIPYEQILLLCTKVNADLIIISPKGKSAIEGLFFGSTTDKVVHRATCNVMVTKKK